MDQKYAKYIQDKLTDSSNKFNTKGEKLLYEQGILIGLILALVKYDSKNFDIVRKKLEKLK
jgi:hypothetical protein